jgi:ABC-type nitrate/sulfonate/bicarbonate transport system substrate-binding protein
MGRSILVALFVSLLAGSMACRSGPGPSAVANPTATASARPLTKVTVSQVGVVAGFLPAWYAKDKGLFAKNGLDVQFVSITGSAGLGALLSGETQFAFLGGTEVLNGAIGGADPVSFLNVTQKQNYVIETPASIKTVQDLKGKKVGVSSFGSTSDTAARQALQAEGLDPSKDVTIVAVGDVPTRTTAMLTGAIQADLTTAPDSFNLEAKGFHPLIDLSELPLPVPVTSYAAKRSYMDQHHDIVQAFTDSMVEAVAQEAKDPDFSVATLMKYFNSTDKDTMTKTYEFVLKTQPGPPDVTVEQFKGVVDQVAQTNAKANGFDLSKVVDQSFIKSSIARGLAK